MFFPKIMACNTCRNHIAFGILRHCSCSHAFRTYMYKVILMIMYGNWINNGMHFQTKHFILNVLLINRDLKVNHVSDPKNCISVTSLRETSFFLLLSLCIQVWQSFTWRKSKIFLWTEETVVFLAGNMFEPSVSPSVVSTCNRTLHNYWK